MSAAMLLASSTASRVAASQTIQTRRTQRTHVSCHLGGARSPFFNRPQPCNRPVQRLRLSRGGCDPRPMSNMGMGAAFGPLFWSFAANPKNWSQAEDAFQKAWKEVYNGAGMQDGQLYMATDAAEYEDRYEFVADLPGVEKTDIQVQVNNDNVLTISGERKAPAQPEEEKEKTRRAFNERRHGKFVRKFKLAEDADASSITARSENGVLRLTVPKQQKAEPNYTNIPVA